MAKIDEKSYDNLMPYDIQNTKTYADLVSLKRVNPSLKVLISIGSFKDGTMSFVKMARDAQTRKRFVKNVISFLNKYQFDGIEINWSMRNVDSVLFSSLSEIEELRTLFTTLCAVKKKKFLFLILNLT
jgi:GH18 family chitinase